MTIRVFGPRDTRDPLTIDTTSRSPTWSRNLSPFYLGPIPLYRGAPLESSKNFENAWQYAKVYGNHADESQAPTLSYWKWAQEGWSNSRAVRYPMGKGAIPLYSLWGEKRLSYIEARKTIYFPLYARAVVTTDAFAELLALYRTRGELSLWDFDGYDHTKLGMSLKDVLECPSRKMGHSFVLAYLLERLR